MEQQSRESKEKLKPGQRRVKRDSTNFKATLPLFGVGNKQGNISTISAERMSLVPVSWDCAVYFLVDSLRAKRNKLFIRKAKYLFVGANQSSKRLVD